MTITLYSGVESPPCLFVQAVAKHLDIELKVKNLDFAKKEHLSDEYLKINPFHKIPAIDDEGFIVYESNAIAYYFLRKYAPESQLYPSCIKKRACIDQILSCIATTIRNATADFIIPRAAEKTKPTVEEIAAFEKNVLKGLEHLIGDDKFAVGESFTLADIALTTRLPVALEINPFHKVPAIEDDGFVLYESNAIAYYLLRKYAPESKLYPAGIEARTRIDQILSSIATTIHTAIAVFMRPRITQKTKPTTEDIAEFEQNYVRGLDHLIGGGKFAVGDTFTLADIALTTRVVVALEVMPSFFLVLSR
ncbi:hypothetical protein MTO96_022546 [Rhipicephalus appendiculatus]